MLKGNLCYEYIERIKILSKEMIGKDEPLEDLCSAAISGDMLTTSGIPIETDMNRIKEFGYEVELWNE